MWPHGLQHIELLCPPLSLRICSNPCPLSWWCHPTISSSVTPFSSCPQSFPGLGSFPMGWLFTSGDQKIGASDSASFLPMNIQGLFPLALTRLISLYHFKEAESRQHCISFCYLINFKTKQAFWLVNIRNYFVCNSFEYKSQDVTDFFLL